MKLHDQLRIISAKNLASLSGVSVDTINRARRYNRLCNTPAGYRVRAALKRLFGPPTDEAEISDGYFSEESLAMQLIREELRLKRARVIELERKNANAARELVPFEEVNNRIQAAGVELRKAAENARRDVASVCCDQCKGIVADTMDFAYQALMKRVTMSLNGDSQVG